MGKKSLLLLLFSAMLVLARLLVWLWRRWTRYAEEERGADARQRRPHKTVRIADLLESDDADELLSNVRKRIERYYGPDPNVMELKKHERVFLLVDIAWGIIGNGGFHYLFEQRIRGDPRFEETAAAFAAVGCDGAAEAFAKVFELFPDGRPPEDVEERLRLYRRGPGAKRGPIDKQFFAASKEIPHCLRDYVLAYGEQFAELDRLLSQRPVKKRKSRPPINESEGPAAGDVVPSLPHWARVAFAARCGRRVWPLFLANWPNALPQRSQAVTRALELAEMSAAAARPADGLKDAVRNALQTAGGAMLAMSGITFDSDEEEEDEPLPQDGNAAIIASFAAKTAEKAAETASSSPAKSADVALEAFGFARQTAGDTSDLIESLWQELMQLQRVARRGDWTDQTPVPANVWELLQ